MNSSHDQTDQTHNLKSSTTNIRLSGQTTKKLSFWKSGNPGKSQVESVTSDTDGCNKSQHQQTSDHEPQHETLRIKRKSRAKHGHRKKRSSIISGSISTETINEYSGELELEARTPVNHPGAENKHALQVCLTSTPLAGKEISKLQPSHSKTLHRNSISDVSFSNFLHDDHIFAEFDLSDAVASSCKSLKFNNVSLNSGDRNGEENKIRNICNNGILNNEICKNGENDNLCITGEIDSMIDILEDAAGQSYSAQIHVQSENGNSFYGLPMKVKEMLLAHRGIDKLYEWQDTCLRLPAIKERRNLIYSLPTSGGKTLVAEILMMKEMLLHKKDVMMVLPFVSIVQEKVKSLTQFAVELGFVVEEYASSKGTFPPRKRRNKRALYIATIEKANALVNSLIESQRLESLGLVVVDELHMLGEGGGRGATLEMCLSKTIFSASHVHVIGMSATLSNIADLQHFLKAEIYSDDFRPVELQEFVKVGSAVYQVPSCSAGHDSDEVYQQVRHVRHKQAKDQRGTKDPDHLVPLVLEVVPQHSCLVFCATKKNCENVAKLLVEFLPSCLQEEKAEERMSLLKALYYQANGLCPVLKYSVPYGIAYHHSGLTMDERKLIEDAYSQGVLCVLTCTSTLAAGVNLPAKRVILRAPYIGRNILSRSQYKQMVGRAGRAGIDSSGESILIIQDTDKSKIGHLFRGSFDSCQSSLPYQGSKGLRTLFLSLLGLKLCKTKGELVSFLGGTLMAIQSDESFDGNEIAVEALQALTSLGHVKEMQKDHDNPCIEVTHLGHATYKGCLDIDEAPTVYKEIKRAMENMVLINELHLLYLVTPLDQGSNVKPDWMTYQREVATLSPDEQKAASLVGITDLYLLGRAYGRKLTKCEVKEDVVQRFHKTLMLYKLMQGCSIWYVASLFQVSRGFVQNLLTSAASFASCLVRFTEELSEFWTVKLLLEAMVKKLSYTTNLELIPLMEVPGIKQARARQLFKAGYRALNDLAWADPPTLMDSIEHLNKRQAQQIISAAKMLLNEKADALREEAEEMVTVPSAINAQ